MKLDFRAVLFDLDGTLADTLADLANATNSALEQLGCPPHPVDAYRKMVGDGVRQLCARAMPKDKQGLVEEALILVRKQYEEHCFDLTRLYDGIPALVIELHHRGLKLAVLSNKPDDFTNRMIEHYFTPLPFEIVRGQRPGVPLKPDPAAALQIAEELGVPPQNWLYLGDTNTDMRTAKAAGMQPVGVMWGFRKRKELVEAGAEFLIAKPNELLSILD